jgi:molybdopterin synthase catalytic subunit
MSQYLIKTADCPSQDAWIREAKTDPSAEKIGMYLTHTGVVRKSAKAKVRYGETGVRPVSGMFFSYDDAKVESAIGETLALPGIYYVRVWLNSGELVLGDTIMQVLIGGDIRPHVIDGLQSLVGKIKSECVVEEERYE